MKGHPRWIRAVKDAAKQRYALVCLAQIVYNARFQINRMRGHIDTASGATHTEFSVAESLRYITEVFQDYKAVAGIERFSGRIAEAGPGDNAGVALCFLADGCTHVDLADRFYSLRNAETQRLIYAALAEADPRIAKLLQGCNLGKEESFPFLTRHYGPKAAAETFFVDKTGFDYVVSRSVLEHVEDPCLALRGMMQSLNPSGKLIHKVDLRDHGMFSGAFHALKFLEVPQTLYSMMTWKSGAPNRILINDYKQYMQNLPCEHQILITSLVGIGELKPHLPYEQIPISTRNKALAYMRQYRQNFAPRFKNMAEEDLIVSGFFLAATKHRL